MANETVIGIAERIQRISTVLENYDDSTCLDDILHGIEDAISYLCFVVNTSDAGQQYKDILMHFTENIEKQMKKCSSKSNEFTNKQLADYLLYEEVLDEKVAAIAALLDKEDARLRSSAKKEVAEECHSLQLRSNPSCKRPHYE